MKVLIVGNGFDRKIGLKTDYISFLEWMKEKGYGVGSDLLNISNSIFHPKDPYCKNRVEVIRNTTDSGQFYGGVYSVVNDSINQISFNPIQEGELVNKLLYLFPEILTNKSNIISNKPNVWYCFLQLLRYEKINRLLRINISMFEEFLNDDGKWIDIEGLLQKSIQIRIQDEKFKTGIFSLTTHFDIFSLANCLLNEGVEIHQKEANKIYDLVWNDFLEFKGLLCQYFTSLQTVSVNLNQYSKYCDNYITANSYNLDKFIINFNDYNSVINFNYTNYVIESNNSYYVHGKVTDIKKVVFGFDVNIKNGVFDKDERKSSFEIELSKNKSLNRFSKVSQLFELQIDKPPYINRGLIRELAIVGHSIGEQDYSYYFSLLDRKYDGNECVDLITIVGLWYTFGDKDNKEEMKESLFEMLTQYERYANKKVLHRMIFEGRIKFKEAFVPELNH